MTVGFWISTPCLNRFRHSIRSWEQERSPFVNGQWSWGRLLESLMRSLGMNAGGRATSALNCNSLNKPGRVHIKLQTKLYKVIIVSSSTRTFQDNVCYPCMSRSLWQLFVNSLNKPDRVHIKLQDETLCNHHCELVNMELLRSFRLSLCAKIHIYAELFPFPLFFFKKKKKQYCMRYIYEALCKKYWLFFPMQAQNYLKHRFFKHIFLNPRSFSKVCNVSWWS